MTAPSQDAVAEFTARIAELEQELQSRAGENGRLQHELALSRERQRASAEILRAISDTSGDDERALRQIAETTARLFAASSVTLRITGGDPWSRTIAVGPGAERIVSQVSSSQLKIGGKNFPGTIVAENRQIHLPDIFNVEPPYSEFPGLIHGRLAGARVMAGTPLRREGEAIGALILQRDRPEPFSDEELELLQSFADQAVIAIENARLFNETREALERQTATADILKVIASSPSNVQPVFEAIAASSNQLLGGFSTAVFRFIDDTAHLAAFTPTNPAADAVLKNTFPRPVGDFAPFALARRGEAVQIPDTDVMPEPEIQEIARARGFRSMLLTPLISNGLPIGLISVTRTEPGAFVEQHVQLLRTFADQAVIAIENVRLFEEVQTRTRDLTEALQQQTATADVLKVISRSAFDLQTVLETLIRSAVELSGARRGVIFLREGEQFNYQAASAADLHPDWIQYLRSNPQKAGRHSAIARAIESGQVVCVPDVLADREITMPATALAGIRAVLAVPLLRDGKVEGIMALSRQVPGPFNERQIELVQTFADQALIAVENARLLRELRHRTAELSRSLEELRAAQDRLVQTEKLASLGQLTAGIAHEIKNPLNFVNNFAALSAELTDELNEALAQASLTGTARADVDELTGLLKDNLRKIVQHGRRADSIVKNMLLHSREGSGDHRPTDVNALVEESLNLAYHGARAERPQFNVTLRRELDPAAGTAELFPQEITRVLLNLISNGFYATAKRGSENGEGFEPVLSASTCDRGAHVEIRIRDNGTGIPPEVKEKMFNPFFTTKPAGEGTGLGLSMSHDIIVKQHGGTIDVDTVPGEFTEFTILLPRKSSFSETNRG